MITIGNISRNDLLDMLPHVAPHLAKGLGELEFDAGALLADIESNRTQVWAIVVDDEVSGAFLTSIRQHEDGARDLDVYGLGGERIMRWGKALSDRMADFARHHSCRRVVFAGRKALAKAYGDTVRVIGTTGGNLIYERAL